jgi:pimeloyl-ACP methyl ester carboxylesterase
MAGHHMSRYVDDVIAVLDAAEASRAAMIGYSLGARVGYAVAAKHPERLSGIVGLDCVPAPAAQPADWRRGAAKVMADGTRAVIEEMASRESQPPPPWLVDHLCATGAAAFAGGYEAFATAPPFWSLAGRMTVPTLFLLGVGEDDDDYWALGQSAASEMPDARAVALPGLGHLQAFWRTDLALPPIRRFLSELSSDAGTWRGRTP